MIDELDIKIIWSLFEDPNRPLDQIAKDLGVSKGTVRNRIIKLKKKHIIVGSSLKVNWREVGVDEVYLGINIRPELYLKVLDIIKGLEFVKMLVSTSGDHSAIAYIIDESGRIMDDISKINNIEGVEKTYPAFVTSMIKW